MVSVEIQVSLMLFVFVLTVPNSLKHSEWVTFLEKNTFSKQFLVERGQYSIIKKYFITKAQMV